VKRNFDHENTATSSGDNTGSAFSCKSWANGSLQDVAGPDGDLLRRGTMSCNNTLGLDFTLNAMTVCPAQVCAANKGSTKQTLRQLCVK
jgi:hypothetical protein